MLCIYAVVKSSQQACKNGDVDRKIYITIKKFECYEIGIKSMYTFYACMGLTEESIDKELRTEMKLNTGFFLQFCLLYITRPVNIHTHLVFYLSIYYLKA